MEIKSIAVIRTDFTQKFGLPRQSGRVPQLTGRVVFNSEYRVSEALRGIEQFSHLWLIFDFSRAHSDTFSPTVRPPRLGGNERVGVFASRSPFRPNSLGLSCVKLERVEHTASEGDVLIVSGVDLLDGTPIYDIKPYLPTADCITNATGGYASEHNDYKLTVKMEERLLSKVAEDKRQALLGCLADDPRPSYHDDGREYGMNYAGYEVKFTVSGDTLTVVSVD